jgi:hypothetical protein
LAKHQIGSKIGVYRKLHPRFSTGILGKTQLQQKEKVMNSKIIMFLAILVAASAGVVGSAQAQTDGTEIANVPFDFYAGGQKMPAGKYTIGIDVEGERITLRDASGQHGMFLMGIPEGDADNKSELVFEHTGDVYALKEVKSDVIEFGLAFYTKVSGQATASRISPSQVEVALNRP